jgi:DNA-binding MarR family transcriptional regulator
MSNDLATFSLKLFRLRYEWRALLRDALKDHDISAEEWLILTSLKSSNGLNMTELSDLQGVNLPNVSKHVDKLSDKALVYRLKDPKNHRIVIVNLTDFGVKLLSEITKSLKPHQSKFLKKKTDDRWRGIAEYLN